MNQYEAKQEARRARYWSAPAGRAAMPKAISESLTEWRPRFYPFNAELNSVCSNLLDNRSGLE